MFENDQAQGGVVQRKARREPGVDMTPMIDCVFLLIIFFMLATTFSPLPGIRVKLPPPSSRPKTEEPKNFMLKISDPLPGNPDGVMTLGPAIVNMGDLSTQFLQGSEDQKETLIIRSGRRVRHEQVVEVMDRAKLAGIKKIGFAMVSKSTF